MHWLEGVELEEGVALPFHPEALFKSFYPAGVLCVCVSKTACEASSSTVPLQYGFGWALILAAAASAEARSL